MWGVHTLCTQGGQHTLCTGATHGRSVPILPLCCDSFFHPPLSFLPLPLSFLCPFLSFICLFLSFLCLFLSSASFFPLPFSFFHLPLSFICLFLFFLLCLFFASFFFLCFMSFFLSFFLLCLSFFLSFFCAFLTFLFAFLLPLFFFHLPTDVMMVTPWLAPIVWNGTFDIDILNAQFHKRDVHIGLTVFALKKYTVFLENFIETAEKYFMVGHKVHYYVFTDRPQDIPSLSLAEGRTLDVTEVTSYKRWQDVTMRRMQIISENCLQRFIFEVDYLVCADVDMIFSDHVGVEILSDVFAAIHPGFFQANRKKFTNERRPRSHGFIPKDEGDYYYTGLASFCHNAMMADKVKKWRYFLYYKPTKVLSPEYVWNNYYGSSVYVPSKRFVHVEKDYVRIRSD
uniref:Uncharacterized protein n=1 Tax=Leptobrachium leishanense TaxID=445787 RepID=A0A8C5R5J8_9ANUR